MKQTTEIQQAWNTLVRMTDSVAQRAGSLMTPQRQKAMNNEATGFFLVAGESIGDFKLANKIQYELAGQNAMQLFLQGVGYTTRGAGPREGTHYNHATDIKSEYEHNNPLVTNLIKASAYVMPEIGLDEQGRIIAVAHEGDEVVLVFYRGPPEALSHLLQDEQKKALISTRNIDANTAEVLGDPAMAIKKESRLGGEPLFIDYERGIDSDVHGGSNDGGTHIDVIPGTALQYSGHDWTFNKVTVNDKLGVGADLHLELAGMGDLLKLKSQQELNQDGIRTRGLQATIERYQSELPISPNPLEITNDPQRHYTIDMVVLTAPKGTLPNGKFLEEKK